MRYCRKKLTIGMTGLLACASASANAQSIEPMGDGGIPAAIVATAETIRTVDLSPYNMGSSAPPVPDATFAIGTFASPMTIASRIGTDANTAFLQTSEKSPPTADASLVRSPYRLSTFGRQTGSIKWEAGAVVAGISFLGVTNWKWGSSKFRFHSEGWFGLNTGSFGTDKFGHAFSTYVIAEFLGAAIRHKSGDSRGGPLTAGLLAMGMMTYTEIFDGFSVDHGFSWEDMIADAAGATFSVLRQSVPGLRDKLDFRLQYIPSNNRGFHPITDYSGQRYIFALKLSGFPSLQRSPLRFVELHAGYYARGFSVVERARGDRQRREPFIGVGLNVSELLFGQPRSSDSKVERIGRSALEYIQIPYTAIHSK